jgi:hypothetical protein
MDSLISDVEIMLNGYSYVSRIIPHVPQKQENKELYPVPYLKSDPHHDILKSHNTTCFEKKARDIEKVVFGNGTVVINHSSVNFTSIQRNKEME